MKNLKLILAIAFVFVLASCKKSDPEPTNTEKLSGKTWKITAATISPAINGQTDFLNQIPSCTRDNTITFNTNGTYTEDESTTKCNANDPQAVQGTWVFGNNETVITTKENGSNTSQNSNVVQNDGNVLKISQVTSINNVVYTVTLTYGK